MVALPGRLRLHGRKGVCEEKRETHSLWRAVDHEGEVSESFVNKSRDRKAALRFLVKSMKRYGQPQTIVMDKLRSYSAAMNNIGNAEKQQTGRWLNNRVENSHPLSDSGLLANHEKGPFDDAQ